MHARLDRHHRSILRLHHAEMNIQRHLGATYPCDSQLRCSGIRVMSCRQIGEGVADTSDLQSCGSPTRNNRRCLDG